MSNLKPLLPLSDNPDFVTAVGNVVSRSAGHVCSVCGLGQFGHAPESEWLGYSRHGWSPISATTEMLDNANKLTTLAYRSRDKVAKS